MNPEFPNATKSQILKKNNILSAWIETRQTILAEVSNLSKEQQGQVFLGIWSIKDLLSHFIGWDHANLDAVKSVMANQVPSFYEYRDRDWQTYNAMLVEIYKKDSVEKFLQR